MRLRVQAGSGDIQRQPRLNQILMRLRLPEGRATCLA
jgi:hypothetical protein